MGKKLESLEKMYKCTKNILLCQFILVIDIIYYLFFKNMNLHLNLLF